MKKLTLIIFLCYLLCVPNIAVAKEKIALNYNITANIKNGYVIDSVSTKEIEFSLFENEDILYLNNIPLEIENNKFKISIEGLKGKQEFVVTNSANESVTYTYYISDEDGYLENFKFEEIQEKTYIKTINNVSIIYTSKEKHLITKIEKILSEIPQNMLVNLKEIKLLPTNHKSEAAGITKYNKITLYNLSKYCNRTIKNILIHEITHTWAQELIKNKVLDYSYSDYKLAVNLDNHYPSAYARDNVAIGNYSEDFAESISFFLIDSETFELKYPARTNYIKTIIEK